VNTAKTQSTKESNGASSVQPGFTNKRTKAIEPAGEKETGIGNTKLKDIMSGNATVTKSKRLWAWHNLEEIS